MSKDVLEKRLEEYEDVFADAMDNLFLGGKGIVREDNLVPRPATAYTRRVDGSIRGGIRDIRMDNTQGGKFRLICGIENQSKIDNTMPVRVMGYEYANYESQIKKIADENRQEERDAGAAGIFNGQKLQPVMTGILYYGRADWKKPLRLYDMLEFPDGIEEEVKHMVVDYPIHVVQLARLTEEERGRLKSDLRLVAEYLACEKEKDKWEKFLWDEEYEIRHLEKLVDLLGEISRDRRYEVLLERIRKENREKEAWRMCNIAEELEKIGVEKGIEQGMKKGMEKGVFALVKDNLKQGVGRQEILEKLIYYFELSKERADEYYNLVTAG